MNTLLKKKLFLFFLSILFLNFSLTPRSFFKKISSFNKKNWDSVREMYDNFFEVEKSGLYRSGQLGAQRLDYYIKKYGIKTVVNLRGKNIHKNWWWKEKMIAERNHIKFYNISMNASSLPSRKNLRNLLYIYEYAPKPIYIHCLGGSDRTGEAAALWILDQQGKSNDEALKQLSIKYRHQRLKNPAKDFFIKIWRDRNWALDEYDPTDYPAYN